jgi:pimeloyl-ACP methyl ester carboxylesterase
MTPHQLNWSWGGKSIEVGIDTRGEGPTILMLPALSSISTRSEMRPLAERLASDFTTVAVDWPGFGDRPRPAVAWEPNAYRKFLGHLARTSEADGNSCGRSCCRVLARPCCRTSRLARQVMSRRADVARAAANNDGRTPCHVPIHF